MTLIDIKESANFLRGNDNFIVYNHALPDGDALGSACALVMILRAIGKTAFAYSPDGIPKKLDFLPTEGIFVDNPEEKNGFIPLSVDIAGPKMLGGAKVPYFALSFDHHRVNTLECERLCVMSDRIATGEMVFLLLDELGVELTKSIAAALYTAICSDSGGFRYDLTTAETHRMAARALETGIDFAYITRRLFECRTVAQTALTKLAYNKLEILHGGRFALVAVTGEEAKECGAADGDFDCIYAIPREIDGVLASAVIRAKENGGAKISLRSNADIDVASIAQRYGGGGHYHAAGITVDFGVDKAEELVKTIFAEIDKQWSRE